MAKSELVKGIRLAVMFVESKQDHTTTCEVMLKPIITVSCMCATRFPGPRKHYIFTRILIFYGLFMCLKKIQMLSYLTLCTCNFKCKVIIIFECTLGAFFINPFEQSLRLLSKYIAVFFMKSCKA